jgi:hypothetical protein
MTQKIMLISLVVSGALLAGWGFTLVQDVDIEESTFAENVNLALRQTGHHLLSLNGDHSSRIMPIENPTVNEFMLSLKNEFNYDTLPYLLDAAFADYGIDVDYHVAVRDCDSEELILGYNLAAFKKKEVPCIGREDWSSCNHVHVVFRHKKSSKAWNILGFLGFAILGMFFLIQFFQLKKRNQKNIDQPVNQHITPRRIGQTLFDHQNQKIVIGELEKNLTFRESKLLNYFVINPNQVLERKDLLAEVWGDEGVIVGRSLDVFISRLRKILKDDPSIQIKNVHGVGYRFEVEF